MKSTPQLIDEITKSNGELDASKFASKMNILVQQLDELEIEANNANLMPTKNSSGKWIFKTENINADKIEKIGKNALMQSLLTKELMDTQIQAMQIALGSYEAMETVNKELTSVIDTGFKDSAETNAFLFEKTKEQIKRVAAFSKRHADGLKEIEDKINNKFTKYVLQQDFETLNETVLGLNDAIDHNKQNILQLENYIEETKKQIYEGLAEYVRKQDFEKINDVCASLEQIRRQNENLEKKINDNKEDQKKRIFATLSITGFCCSVAAIVVTVLMF